MVFETVLLPMLLKDRRKERFDSGTALGSRIIYMLSVLFSVWAAAIAYRCNNNGVLMALFAFFFPITYVIIHAVHRFECNVKGAST